MKDRRIREIGEFLDRHSCFVITGASSGIGEAIAGLVLKTRPNFPVCCVSRTVPKESFASCENFLHVPCDLSSSKNIDDALPKIFKFLSDFCDSDSNGKPRRGILINNAGFGLYGSFDECDVDRVKSLIEVNVKALTVLCSELMPKVDSIVNISSTAAWQACPYLDVYAASKAYVLSFSMGLDCEMRSKGLGRCLCVCPGPTSSNIFRAAGWSEPPLPSGFGHKAEEVAESTLTALARGKTLKIVGVANKLQVFLSRLLPPVLLSRISGAILSRIRAVK